MAKGLPRGSRRPAQDIGRNLPSEHIRGVSQADTLTPADRYQELFIDVQMSRVFEDSKTFVDCAPLRHPEKILADYRNICFQRDFDLRAFINDNFTVEEVPPNCFVSDPDKTLAEHIENLWPILTRRPREHPVRSSLLPLPNDYVVPGGRFSELYYWDSYFTMLGLHGSSCRHCGRLLRAMADNFAYLIDTYGHVPNGNRTYYLSRSQPPVFCLMVELFEQTGVQQAVNYLPQLRKEYTFWMDGSWELRPGEAYRRCVRMEDGSFLNRYWDDRSTPREESYAEDVLTARRSDRPAHEVYRNLRAGAESGWDFSSRWLGNPASIATIRTTSILPVDLNCFLLKLEQQIAHLSARTGDRVLAGEYDQRARTRCAAIDRYLWNRVEGAYFDYDIDLGRQRENLTAATATPLFVQAASDDQARRVTAILQARMLAPGGVSTTEFGNSGQQWDRPNGWAPLQWMTMQGLLNYDQPDLAREISRRWLRIVSELYELESKLVEKYVLRPTDQHATGGEYPLQDGFGWTNGVVARLLRQEPCHQANQCRAGTRSRH